MIHVCISFDHNFINQFASLLESILQNRIKSSMINFHLIYENPDEDVKEKIIKRITEEKLYVNFYTIDVALLKDFKTSCHWNLSTYYKLLFADMVAQEVNKILYIDTDTTVLKDLNDLYTTDLQDKCIAAVYDNYVKGQRLIDITEGSYFNAGMMLIDVHKWRDKEITKRCIEFILQNPEKIKFVDQCALNYLLKNDWLELPKEYNLLYSYIDMFAKQSDIDTLVSSTYIVHYTLNKPWQKHNLHPFEKKYKNYGMQSTIVNFKHKTIESHNSLIVNVKNCILLHYNRYPMYFKKPWQFIKKTLT